MLCTFTVGTAMAESCAQPPPWSEATARHGRPEAEVAICLRDHAWDVRDLKVPVNSAVAGIVAQCEVRVVFFEGPRGSPYQYKMQQRVDDNDRNALAQALADVTWARRCAGR
jgi:hypothetical protein